MMVLQEVGRAGRDGRKAEALLYHTAVQYGKCDEEMKSAMSKVREGQCLRLQILQVWIKGKFARFPHSEIRTGKHNLIK